MKSFFLLGVLLALANCLYAQDNWQATFNESEMDHIKTITLMNTATHSSNGSGNTLVIRCSKKLEVYVSSEDVVDFIRGNYDDVTAVRIKFDENKPMSQVWNLSTDSHGFFSPNAKTFLLSAAKSTNLVVEYRPFEKVPATTSFSLSGLKDQLHKYYECRRFGF